MTERTYNVLILCTGNSARSIMAEALINTMGQGRFRAYSAGSHPAATVQPLAAELIAGLGLPAGQLRTKSWDEFDVPGAPVMDFVITVCDNAAGEACPVWPGKPVTAHWGIADPAAVEGGDLDKEAAFVTAFRQLKNRIAAFAALPVASLDRMTLDARLREIGRMEGATRPDGA